jgi:hypothetical protein
MSAAATAAGYLYASGRLRGKNKDENGERKEASRPPHQHEKHEVRVAVIHKEQDGPAQKRQPKIQYRTRRWKPEE